MAGRKNRSCLLSCQCYIELPDAETYTPAQERPLRSVEGFLEYGKVLPGGVRIITTVGGFEAV
jgi:hypothetical protein